jgi:hypothetical protein
LIAPFTGPDGVVEVPTNVDPVYAGSELLFPGTGWVIVRVGHCTRKDCEIAAGAATRRQPNATRTALVFLLNISLLLQPLLTPQLHFSRRGPLMLSGKYGQRKWR